ncbi:MAG TPA: DMT family transporter [Candidatus Acidoferrum sp.]|nr:DMT family transporter [Candidatus Acidoferrum sp.]
MSALDHTTSASTATALHRRGLLLVAGAALVWSSGGLLARMIETDPWTKLFWRSVFACISLLAYAWFKNRGRLVATFRELGWPGMLLGLCFATASTGFIVGLDYTTVANILFTQAAAPFIAGLLGWVLLREQVKVHSWIAMAVALAGIGVISHGSLEAGNVVGNLLAITCALGFAGAIVTTRRFKHLRMAPATCLATLFCALVSLPFARLSAPDTSDFAYLFLFGCGQMGLGLVLFTSGVRLIPGAEAGLISILESILSPLWVWVFLSETPSVDTLVGGAIVLGAIVVHTLLDWRAERTVVPTPD